MSQCEGKCKWCKDGICVNDKSPCVTNYCPVVNTPQLCKYADMELNFEFKINALKMDGDIATGLISTTGYTIEFRDKEGNPLPLNKKAVERFMKATQGGVE